MSRIAIAGGVFTTVLVLLALAAAHRLTDREVAIAPPVAPAVVPTPASTGEAQGFLYGRVTTLDGGSYEGRLRWGGGEEAFWSDYFNGSKKDNPWIALTPVELVESRPLEIFGITIARRDRPVDFSRPFMARFGDLVAIEARGRDVRVTLKSGTTFDLDRFDASDLDDGLRVWDEAHGVVDLDSLRIHRVDFLPTPPLAGLPGRLFGTVTTQQGDFTGFLQWDREESTGSDTLDGRGAAGDVSLRFDTVAAIARHGRESSLVTLVDGREVVLSDTPDVGDGNRGIYVDDPCYGRVLVSWDAFLRADFAAADRPAPGSGPGYGDFPPGRQLTGSVTTRDGRRLAGQLVFDLDESETIETLDAPSGGIDYTLPFSLIARLVLPDGGAPDAARVRVILHDGEELALERRGDLGAGNAGLLVFGEDRERPEYVPWSEVGVVTLDPESAPVTGPAHRDGRVRG